MATQHPPLTFVLARILKAPTLFISFLTLYIYATPVKVIKSYTNFKRLIHTLVALCYPNSLTKPTFKGSCGDSKLLSVGLDLIITFLHCIDKAERKCSFLN